MKAPLVVIVAVGAAFAQPQITREGNDWVQVLNGVVPGNGYIRLRVVTEGDVRVRGQKSDSRISFTLKKRVRAGTLREAERLLADFNIRTVIGGTAASITVVGPRGPVHSSDFSVTVPASLKSAVLETQAGNLIASDLAGELNGQTRAGRIELDRLGAAASVRTGGGEVHVGRVAGGVRCYSGGGNIRAEAVGTDSWFETAGGDIQIGEGSGPIHAMTAGGNIKVDRCSADVFARTGAGVIDVRQAGGLVTADNSSGAIQIESARGVRCESSAGRIRLRNVGDGG
ncbi:MAG: hypothetical protein JO022_01795, partial [Acidobacteriaceae bacterium]|nr:hypothetical protein [Acidobacteriaceae bacterium]